MSETKLLIFDLWDTVIHVQDPHPITEMQRIMEKTDMGKYDFSVEFENSLMTEPFAKMKEGFLHVLDDFCVEPTDEKIMDMSDVWTRTMQQLFFPEEIKEMLKFLRGKFKMGLLTNTDIFSYTYAKTKFNIESYFDHLIPSYETGVIKPDKKPFDMMLSHFKAIPEECCMIGDNLFNDIIPAKTLNMKTVYIDIKKRITGEPHADITVRSLEEFVEVMKNIQ